MPFPLMCGLVLCYLLALLTIRPLCYQQPGYTVQNTMQKRTWRIFAAIAVKPTSGTRQEPGTVSNALDSSFSNILSACTQQGGGRERESCANTREMYQVAAALKEEEQSTGVAVQTECLPVNMGWQKANTKLALEQHEASNTAAGEDEVQGWHQHMVQLALELRLKITPELWSIKVVAVARGGVKVDAVILQKWMIQSFHSMGHVKDSLSSEAFGTWSTKGDDGREGGEGDIDEGLRGKL
ncbi:hypothetical protein BJY52DRAFT_1231016 [Lactarius psammicola]|nr:hypothetical protein BJY52DRAFT_1231016 [Lactarius psammicola]